MSRPALDRVSEQAIDWMVELRLLRLTRRCCNGSGCGCSKTPLTNRPGTAWSNALAIRSPRCSPWISGPLAKQQRHADC